MSVASLFGLGTPCDIDITFHQNSESNTRQQRKQVEVKLDRDRRQKFPLYLDAETVAGKVSIHVKDGKRLEHLGITLQFIGAIELFQDRSQHFEFLSLVQELSAPAELTSLTSYDFQFKNVEKPYESYCGPHVRLRYFVKVTVARRLLDVVKEREVWVYAYRRDEDVSRVIKMEVGIEDCLHIEFEYNKSRYHLRDVIVGRIYFLLVRLKIKYMELSIIRRETTPQHTDSETLTKFEIMDGAPVKGETIPIRLFLSGFELSPTLRDVNKKFSVRYLLNLVLVDEENRRYFKQQEITLYRRAEDDGVVLPSTTTARPPGLSHYTPPSLPVAKDPRPGYGQSSEPEAPRENLNAGTGDIRLPPPPPPGIDPHADGMTASEQVQSPYINRLNFPSATSDALEGFASTGTTSGFYP